jgi:hypothetical protein
MDLLGFVPKKRIIILAVLVVCLAAYLFSAKSAVSYQPGAMPQAINEVAPLALNTYLAAAAQVPERKVVNNNIIISDRDPKVRIELPKSVWYVGVDRFILEDIAECELYAFVQIDDQKNVERLYWIQFEEYLPSKPELHHQYDSPRTMTIGGFRFYVDTWARRTNENITAGSDEDHIVALILSRGYKMPAAMISLRLVHLLDEQKRKELMIIYSENLKATGFAAADLKKGGKAENLWMTLEDDLLVRAKQEIKIEVP